MFTGAAFVTGKIYVVGGLSDGGSLTDIVRFDPPSSANPVASLPLTNYGPAVTSQGGNLWVFGGHGPGGPMVTAWKYDGSTVTQYYGVVGGPRKFMSAVYTGSYIYLFGGDNDGGYVSEIRRYDPTNPTAQSTVVANLPSARAQTSAIFDGTYAWVFGGDTSSGPSNDIVRFNPANNQVDNLYDLPRVLRSTSAVWDGHRAFIFGGITSGSPLWRDEIVEFTPSSGAVRELTTRLPSVRCCTSAAWFGTGSAYIFGGQTTGDTKIGEIAKFIPSPLAPTNLAASRGPGAGQISLTWGVPPGARPDQYKIYRGTTPGGESFLTTVGDQTAWTDTGLPRNTRYYYKVSGVNQGQEGPQSNEANAVTPDTPSAPLNLAAATGSAPRQIRLTWQAPSDDGGIAVSGYHVYRGTSPGTEVRVASNVPGFSYTDNDPALQDNRTYYYKLTALNPVGEGPFSNGANARTPALPDQPVNVLAVAGSVQGQIRVTWSPPPSDGGLPVTAYKLYRGDSSGTETLYQTLGPVLSFNDNGLPDGAFKCYRLTATNAVGEGGFSDESCTRAPDVPAAPSNFTAATGSAPNNISLTWSAASSPGVPVLNYKVYRGTASGALSLLRTLGNVTSFIDGGIPNGARRYYQVSAVNIIGEGAQSLEASATAPDVPTVVQDCATQRGPDVGQITVNWSQPASNNGLPVTAMRMYYSSAAGGPYQSVALGNVTTYTHIGVPNAAYRYFRVSAINAVGEGPRCDEVRGQAPDVPTPPRNVRASPGDGQTHFTGRILVRWDASSDDNGMRVVEYRLNRTTVAGGEGVLTKLNAAQLARLEYVDKDLLPGVRYYYNITAVNGVGPSLKSNLASARSSVIPDLGFSDLADDDGDLAPNVIDTTVCSSGLTGALIEETTVSACDASGSDWAPLGGSNGDRDDDLVRDPEEGTLCAFQFNTTPNDGVCAHRADGTPNYGPPPNLRIPQGAG